MPFISETKPVYRIGENGPGVVLMHEIPGMTPEVLRLGKLLAQQGFRVALPSLFGTDGRDAGNLLDADMLMRMCVNAQFDVFAANGSSPIIDWIRELCKDLARETGGPVGAIGLCITGGFALSLTIGTDGLVLAPVMSEPSLPFPMPFTNNGAAMHLLPEEQQLIRAKRPRCVALRFASDRLCQQQRFDAYQTLLGDGLVRIEIPSPDSRHTIGPDAHAVLTNELSDASGHPTWSGFERVLVFLHGQLDNI
jgi:dienelactone hydrolase